MTNEELWQQINKRFDGVEIRLGGVETRLGGVETRLGGVETRLGGVEKQVKTLKKEVKSTRETMHVAINVFDKVDNKLRRRIDRIEEELNLSPLEN